MTAASPDVAGQIAALISLIPRTREPRGEEPPERVEADADQDWYSDRAEQRAERAMWGDAL